MAGVQREDRGGNDQDDHDGRVMAEETICSLPKTADINRRERNGCFKKERESSWGEGKKY